MLAIDVVLSWTHPSHAQVFGEKPPVHTIFILESELYEKMMLAIDIDPDSAKTPAILLMREFLSVSDGSLLALDTHSVTPLLTLVNAVLQLG